MLFRWLIDSVLWASRLSIGGDSPDPPKPDPAVGIAAAANAEISQEALAFNKQQWEELRPWREWQFETSKQAASAALTTVDLQNKISADYWGYLKDTFRPLEEKIVADAKAYDTPERRELEAGKAVGEVSRAFDASAENQRRQAESMGLDPSSGRFSDMETSTGIARAAASAGASNVARTNVETLGLARTMDAANLGRNLPSNQATAAQVGLSAGNSASGNALAAGGGALQSAAMMNQGFNSAIGANNASGQLGLGLYNAQMSGWNSQNNASAAQSAGIGSLVGTVAGGVIGMWGGPVGAAAGASIGGAVGSQLAV